MASMDELQANFGHFVAEKGNAGLKKIPFTHGITISMQSATSQVMYLYAVHVE